MSVFNELRLKKQLCDAVIRVHNGEFHVHKIILCNCSPFFKALFTCWSTQDRRDFDFPNVSADIMNIIIEFAYIGSIAVTQDNVQELYIAADYFDVTSIIQACCSFMEERLTSETCIGIRWLTETFYNAELNNKASLFIFKHFEEIAATSEELLLLSVQDVIKIIENDKLNVKDEKIVFEAVRRWINHAPEERKKDLPLLLSHVRLALMSPEHLKDYVGNIELVKSSEECQLILSRTLDAMLDPQDRINRFSESARPRLPPAILLAFGGWASDGATNAIEAYDVRADRWVNVTNNEGDPRAYRGSVFLDGSVYLVGGSDGGEPYNSMHRFDLRTHTWHEMAPMNKSRCYVSLAVLDGYIYAMGGSDGQTRLRTAERYDPRTNRWTFIRSMHRKRSDAGCTTLNGKVYICGGFNGNQFLSSAECYDPETNRWTRIAPMSSRRGGVGVIAYADHIYAVGGFNGSRHLHTAEAYNPHDNTWHAVPPMRITRSNFGIAVIEDRLFVAGGYKGVIVTHDVECFDVTTNAWSNVCNMEIARSGLSCCVVSELPNLAEYAAPRHAPQLSNMREDEND